MGRYSVLPFYGELERELKLTGSKLINSHTEHCFIADVAAWACEGGALEGMTPRTWTEWLRLPEGQYVVNGRTNSRKGQWATHMFCPTLADVPVVAGRLLGDSLISEQGVVVREYIPLRELGEGLNGLPITNEWRTFWLTTKDGPVMLARGFYWASHEEVADKAEWTTDAYVLARKAAIAVTDYATFFVLDMAQTKDGAWIVIEMNDGQMSGLSMVDPQELYSNLAIHLGVQSSNPAP